MGPVLLHTASISRQTTITGTTNKQMQTLYTNVPCLLVPMSPVAAVQNGFDVGNGSNIYFDDGTDVQVGDRITVNGGNYIARGKNPFTGIPIVAHVQIAAEGETANGQ